VDVPEKDPLTADYVVGLLIVAWLLWAASAIKKG